jgi:hypothetical protein
MQGSPAMSLGFMAILIGKEGNWHTGVINMLNISNVMEQSTDCGHANAKNMEKLCSAQ